VRVLLYQLINPAEVSKEQKPIVVTPVVLHTDFTEQVNVLYQVLIDLVEIPLEVLFLSQVIGQDVNFILPKDLVAISRLRCEGGQLFFTCKGFEGVGGFCSSIIPFYRVTSRGLLTIR